VIRLRPEAEAQVDRLIEHYEALGRLQAAQNLLLALEHAKERIAAASDAGLPAPRPYPRLVQQGRLWIKSGRYWIA
jgi:plasmid stabilization system protein ParE